MKIKTAQRKRNGNIFLQAELTQEEYLRIIEVQEKNYKEFHKKVVAKCVELMGEKVREFFDKECGYQEEFEDGESPEDVANNQMLESQWIKF